MSAGQDLHSVLNTLGHDLRGPLFTAHGFLQLLVGRTEGKAQEHARYALASIDEAVRMVNGVLQWARTEPERLEETDVDLAETVAGALVDVEPLRKRQKAQVETGPLPTVRGDPRALRYALQHLLDNALRYGPEGQTVRIEGGTSDDGWWVDVADEGTDAVSLQDHALPFWEAEGRSSGIGIALAHRVASHHGGELKSTGAGRVRLTGGR